MEESINTKNKIKIKLLYLDGIILFGDVFFAIITMLLGIKFKSSEESSIFIIFWITLFIITSARYLYNTIFTTKKILKSELIFYISIMTIICANIITIINREYIHENISSDFLVFGAKIMPLIFSIFYIMKNNYYKEYLDKICKVSLLLGILISTIIIPEIIEGLSRYGFSFNNLSYQSLGYALVQILIANIFNLMFYNDSILINNKRNLIKNIIILIVTFLLIIIVLFLGSRGAAIGMLIVVFSTMVFYPILKTNLTKKQRIRNSIIMFFLLSLVILVITILISTIGSLQIGIKRIVSFIDFETLSIDMSKTSNRDEVYARSFELISKHPIIGNGASSFYYVSGGYPHNFFLQLYVEYGILGLLISIIVSITVFIRLIKQTKSDNKYIFILLIYILTMTKLMVSDNYTINSLFWLCVVVSINKENIKQRILKQEKKEEI